MLRFVVEIVLRGTVADIPLTVRLLSEIRGIGELPFKPF